MAVLALLGGEFAGQFVEAGLLGREAFGGGFGICFGCAGGSSGRFGVLGPERLEGRLALGCALPVADVMGVVQCRKQAPERKQSQAETKAHLEP
ncbi:hypothetical protein DZ899_07280 [Pseudomonas aeruginosa]|nr:hypothetical protein DZ899_07280 [Pseudomonas aeruginosa]PBV15454.1 hypothetical protein CJU34_04885 [Pseudomonas aeruginosa]RPS32351.1 hypothetical protein IPC1018_10090 [Pseudomonas aeruginosa]RQF19367.1 hypothetical protein IPC279_11695 [Pseudomonas aeruginosa]RUC47872.1 hypothetical protein IPC1409_14825 [Pseudomonas aeruginosa]